MKRLLTALLAMLLLLPTACQDGIIDEIAEKKQDKPSNIESFIPSDDAAFMAHVSALFGRAKGKTKMPDIDWKRGKKIKNSKKGAINYTVGLQNAPLQYLIVHEPAKTQHLASPAPPLAYYLAFAPKGQLAYDAKGNLDWTKFTGTMERIGLDGEVLETKEFGLGKANGKVTACGEYLVPVEEIWGSQTTSGSTESGGTEATGTQYILVTICYGGGDAGGGGTSGDWWNTGGSGSSPETWDGGSGGGGAYTSGGSPTIGNTYGEPIAMLDESVEDEAILSYLIDTATDNEERRRLQLEYLKKFGERAFAESIEGILKTPGLNMGDVWQINELVNRVYLNLKGRYMMEIMYPYLEAGFWLVEFALFEAATNILFEGVNTALKTRYGIQIAKQVGTATRTIEQISQGIVNRLKLSSDAKTISISLNGRVIVGQQGSKYTYNFYGVSNAEAKQLFAELTEGRAASHIVQSEKGTVEVVKLNGKERIHLRNFSTSGEGEMTIEFKLPRLIDSPKLVELKFHP